MRDRFDKKSSASPVSAEARTNARAAIRMAIRMAARSQVSGAWLQKETDRVVSLLWAIREEGLS